LWCTGAIATLPRAGTTGAGKTRLRTAEGGSGEGQLRERLVVRAEPEIGEVEAPAILEETESLFEVPGPLAGA